MKPLNYKNIQSKMNFFQCIGVEITYKLRHEFNLKIGNLITILENIEVVEQQLY